jgi:hypothetical protein
MFHLMARLFYFAVIGFIGIVAIGPVAAVVGALLPFALIGLFVFGAYRGVQRLVGARRAGNFRIPAPPVAARRVEPAAGAAHEAAPCPARSGRRGRVVLEVLCGGLVGGAVAAAMCWQTPELAGTVIPAVVAGAVVGYVVGGSSAERGTLAPREA